MIYGFKYHPDRRLPSSAKEETIGNMFLITLNQDTINKYGLKYISETVMSFLGLTEESYELWVNKIFGEKVLTAPSQEWLAESGQLIIGKSAEEYAGNTLARIRNPSDLLWHGHKHILTFEDVLRLRREKMLEEKESVSALGDSVNKDFKQDLI